LTQQTACASDIIVAPVTMDYFEQKYNQKFGGGDGDNGGDGDLESQTVSKDTASITEDDDNDDGDNDNVEPNKSPIPIDIAVVRILQPIEFPSADSLITVLVEPGDYRLDVWFDVDGVFFAATLTGLTTDDVSVVNQQIPAIPELFINASGNSPYAEISGFCFFGWCCGRR